jgi:hypothetical protein
MSYCRWSSDNWRCDLYVYDTGDGIAIHVANNRRAGEIPALPELTLDTVAEYTRAHNAQLAAVNACELVEIGLPYDGAYFEEPDLDSAIDRMKYLRNLGYHVPQWAIEAMEQDREDRDAASRGA